MYSLMLRLKMALKDFLPTRIQVLLSSNQSLTCNGGHSMASFVPTNSLSRHTCTRGSMRPCIRTMNIWNEKRYRTNFDFDVSEDCQSLISTHREVVSVLWKCASSVETITQ